MGLFRSCERIIKICCEFKKESRAVHLESLYKSILRWIDILILMEWRAGAGKWRWLPDPPQSHDMVERACRARQPILLLFRVFVSLTSWIMCWHLRVWLGFYPRYFKLTSAGKFELDWLKSEVNVEWKALPHGPCNQEGPISEYRGRWLSFLWLFQ